MTAVEAIVFSRMVSSLHAQGFVINKLEHSRPWGGFFVIEDRQSSMFIKTYFNDLNESYLGLGSKVTLKILLVAPGKRLSWQYHRRRAEICKVIDGSIGIVRSETNEEKDCEIFDTGSIIRFLPGERHRLIGIKTIGVIAEMWQHTDPQYPSDEMDIVRLADDFGRT
jgi:mannose-6-phosphate isomerase-like protein (cupin superfamily)